MSQLTVRSLALRLFGLTLAGLLTFNASAVGFAAVFSDVEKIIETATARRLADKDPVKGTPLPATPGQNDPGYNELYRGGIRNESDLAKLAAAEQRRFEEFARHNPDVLSASLDPSTLQGGPPITSQAGEPLPDEGIAGINSGLSFQAMHAGSLAPTATEMSYSVGTWGRSSSGSPGMSAGGGNPTTSSGFPGSSSKPEWAGANTRSELNSRTGNVVTTVPIVGWGASGDTAIDLTLVHNSILTGVAGAVSDIGNGWNHTYSMELVEGWSPNQPPVNGDALYLIWSDGQRIQFTFSASWQRFDSPVGYYSTITGGYSGYTLTTKDQWTYNFNADGHLIQQIDPWGNVISVNRDSSNKILSVSDGLGRTLNFQYSGGTRITHVIAPDGKTWYFTRDGSNRLTQVEFPSFDEINYTYDGSSLRIKTITNALGKIWTYNYGLSGTSNQRLTQVITPEGKTWTTSYASTYARMFSPTGGYVQHNYSNGKLVSVVDELGFTTNLVGDASGNLAQATDPLGRIWKWTYDSKGNVLTFTDPLNKKWTYTYNAQNNLTTIKDPMSSTVLTLGYGPSGTNPAPITFDDPVYGPNGLVGYSPTGEVTAVGIDHPASQPDEILVNFTYDAYKNVIQVTDNAGVTSSATYDIMGRALTSTDAAGQTSSVEYDDLGRPWRVTLPDASQVSVVVNGAGQVLSATDQLGRTGYLTYSNNGNVLSATNAKGETHSFTYDNSDRLVTVRNARLKTRTYEYTLRGEVKKLTQPDGAVEQWTFDANGNVASYINALGQTIGFSYNVAGDPTLVNYPTGVDTSFGYDSRARFNQMTDATGTTTWVYNLVGQVTSLTTPQGSFSYEYNTLGQPWKMTDASGLWTTLYDAQRRAYGLTNPWNETTTVQFDTAGRVSRKDIPNGMYETYLFDSRSRLTEIKTYGTGDVLRDTKTYQWDAASRVMSAVEGGVATAYGYDLIDQLTSEDKPALGYSASYTYDANGNRLTRTVNGVTENYSYDDADKLMSITGGNDPRDFTYDLAGRTKTIVRPSGTTTLNYDYDGQVTSIVYPSGGGTDSFAYNGAGARVSSSGANGSKTFRRAGAGVTSPLMSDGTSQYTPGTSVRQGSNTTYQHSGLKNTNDQTDSTETVTASRHYDAFGNLVSSSGNWQGVHGYAGGYGYQEDPNGLRLLGHRYYDSSTGRFMSQDMSGYGSNWYSYCQNNPVPLFDDQGLSPGKIPNPPNFGIPGSTAGPGGRIGPSGWPGVTIVESSSREEAFRKAKKSTARGKTPMHHPKPTTGDAHYHAVNGKGVKKPNLKFIYPKPGYPKGTPKNLGIPGPGRRIGGNRPMRPGGGRSTGSGGGVAAFATIAAGMAALAEALPYFFGHRARLQAHIDASEDPDDKDAERASGAMEGNFDDDMGIG